MNEAEILDFAERLSAPSKQATLRRFENATRQMQSFGTTQTTLSRPSMTI